MDRLHLMTVFVAVAEEESFAAGARRLGMSPPAVTRAHIGTGRSAKRETTRQDDALRADNGSRTPLPG